MQRALPFLALILTACAAMPPLTETTDKSRIGYEARPLDLPNAYELTVRLPPNVPEDYRSHFANRSAGELCKAHKLDYFDVTVPEKGGDVRGSLESFRQQVFCFATPQRLGLDVVLEEEPHALNQGTAPVVQNLNGRSNSGLKPGDFILTVDGKRTQTVADVKRAVHAAVDHGKKEVEIAVIRKYAHLTVKEPLSIRTDFLGPAELDHLRKVIK